MSEVKLGTTSAMKYLYNGRGEQVRRAKGKVVVTIYDEAGHWLGEYNNNAAKPMQQVVWLDDLPVGLIVGDVATNQPLHYIEADALGTPRTIIEAQRNVAVWSWPLAGEAFGSTAPIEDVDGDSTKLIFNMRFPGQRYDSTTGLNYNYHRDYDPVAGGYVESDPVGQIGGLSTYAYSDGRPLIEADPAGLFGVPRIGPPMHLDDDRPSWPISGRQLPSTADLRRHYPNFGRVPYAHPSSNPAYKNQCAIRTSVALQGAGFSLATFKGERTPEGWARGAVELANYLSQEVGPPIRLDYQAFMDASTDINYMNFRGVIFEPAMGVGAPHIDVMGGGGSVGSRLWPTDKKVWLWPTN